VSRKTQTNPTKLLARTRKINKHPPRFNLLRIHNVGIQTTLQPVAVLMMKTTNLALLRQLKSRRNPGKTEMPSVQPASRTSQTVRRHLIVNNHQTRCPTKQMTKILIRARAIKRKPTVKSISLIVVLRWTVIMTPNLSSWCPAKIHTQMKMQSHLLLN